MQMNTGTLKHVFRSFPQLQFSFLNLKKLFFKVHFVRKRLAVITSWDLTSRKRRALVWLTRGSGPKLLRPARLARSGREQTLLVPAFRCMPLTCKSWERGRPAAGTAGSRRLSWLQPSGDKELVVPNQVVVPGKKSPALIHTLDGRKNQDQSAQVYTSASTGPRSPLNGEGGGGRREGKGFWSKSYKQVSTVGIGDSVQAVPFRHTVRKENPRHFSRQSKVLRKERTRAQHTIQAVWRYQTTPNSF